MSKKTKFILITTWILFSRSYDVYCTNQLTTELDRETNVLVSVLGFAWTPLLFTIGAITLYVIYTNYLTIFKPKNLFPPEKDYSFKDFVSYIYFGHKENFTSMLYKMPKDKSRINYLAGHILTICFVFAGILTTIMWLLIKYTNYYKTVHSASVVYSILLIGCAVLMYEWYRREYKEYKKIVILK